MFADRKEQKEADQGFQFADLRGLAFAATIAVSWGCGSGITNQPETLPVSLSLPTLTSNKLIPIPDVPFPGNEFPLDKMIKYSKLSSAELIQEARKEGIKVFILNGTTNNEPESEDITSLRLSADKSAEEFYTQGMLASGNPHFMGEYISPYKDEVSDSGEITEKDRPFRESPIFLLSERMSRWAILHEFMHYWRDKSVPTNFNFEGRKVNIDTAYLINRDLIWKDFGVLEKDLDAAKKYVIPLSSKKISNWLNGIKLRCEDLEITMCMLERKRKLGLSTYGAFHALGYGRLHQGDLEGELKELGKFVASVDEAPLELKDETFSTQFTPVKRKYDELFNAFKKINDWIDREEQAVMRDIKEDLRRSDRERYRLLPDR